MPKGAALRLAVEGEGNKRTLEVFAGDSTNSLWRGPLATTEISGVIAELRKTLEAIHDIAGNALNLDPQRSAKTVDKLLYFSLGVGYGLFRERPGLLYKETRFQAPGAFDPSITARIVEVTAPKDFSFPFELLQWQDLPEDLANDPALRIRALLGMSAIIRRRFGDVDATEGPAHIQNEPKLPLTVFRNASLTAAEKEVDYLTRIGKLVDVYGPWPGMHELAELAAARHLIDSRIGLNGDPRSAPVAILHLACHCNTKDDDNSHYLNVGGPYGKVLLGDLKKQLMTAKGSKAPVPRPLVFLNACGSAMALSSELEWPSTLDLDALKAGGWSPAPFREFVVKIHSRCDLSCDYCYMYEMADQSWRDQPMRMSPQIADRTAIRIGEHARAHQLPAVSLILHGGEPLLAGRI